MQGVLYLSKWVLIPVQMLTSNANAANLSLQKFATILPNQSNRCKVEYRFRKNSNGKWDFNFD
jgi:hypothetical protein